MNTVVEALIEIPMGSQNKYEVNKKTNKIKLDRVLYSAVFYPAEYGYVEDTLALDGDPIDILVLTSYPTFPGCYIDARIIGGLDMMDDGKQDVKILAVCESDPRYDHIHDLDDVAPHILLEIQNFFSTYKTLQPGEVEVGGFLSTKETLKLLMDAKERWENMKKTD